MTSLLNCTLQVSVVLAASLMTLRFLRNQPAALRHWVLAVAIVCSLLIPGLRTILPAWRVALPIEIQPGSRPQAGAASPLPSMQHESEGNPKEYANKGFTVARPQASLPTVAEVQPPPTLAGGIRNIPWIQIVEYLWLGGVVLGFAVVMAGIVQLNWIGRHSVPITAGKWHDIAEVISRDYGLGHSVDLLQSRYPSLLATWGVLRPAVLLPVGAGDWSDDLIHLVLSHEIAHVRRRDWLVQLIGEAFRTIYWFNPLAWIVCARLGQESEQACDDAVLHRGIPGPDYAARLLDLARSLSAGRPRWDYGLRMARRSTLKRRFKAILNPETNRRAVSRLAVILSLAAGFSITVPIAALRASGEAPLPLSVKRPEAQTPSKAPLHIAREAAMATTAAPQSSASIVLANRVYQRVGASHIDWLKLSPPGRQAVKLTDVEKNGCLENQSTALPAEAGARASSIVGNGKLLTWSADQTMFAYVAQDPTVPPPSPNPWGCTDCFYPVLKVSRTSDLKTLATIRLPEFGDRWNYAQSIAWSPDGKTLLVGAEAGISTSHYEDYWLLDWTRQSWRYAGGGNNAKWSPDASQILWTAPRSLEKLGKIGVWVVHLMLLDVRNLKEETLTSGTSYVSDFHWCAK